MLVIEIFKPVDKLVLRIMAAVGFSFGLMTALLTIEATNPIRVWLLSFALSILAAFRFNDEVLDLAVRVAAIRQSSDMCLGMRRLTHVAR